MSELVSFGGGINSTAMTILLVNEGWRGPIVFADTGCEWPDTYAYMDYFEHEWLAPRGMGIERLGGEWRAPAKRPPLIEYCESHGMIPLAGIRWCTSEYKVQPIGRWAKEHGIDEQLIGIAADEAHRQKNRSCPLCDRGITRQGCVEIIQAEGLDVPPKSGCWICPFQRHEQWRELWRHYPELYERAMTLEESTPRTRDGRYTATLDPSGKITLRQRQVTFEQQGAMFDDSELDDLLLARAREVS
jgi:3'-phosphoadenosine 5'-phosphosulfate sulfotransferase (PAPS reductase)/FAD synthetase